MKILFACKELPHSRVIGGPIIIYNRMKHLSRNHRVSLAAFVRPGEEKFTSSLEPFCHDIKLVPFPPRRSFLKALWDFLFSPVPHYFLKVHGSPQMRDTIAEMCRRDPYDVVIAEYSVMGQFLFQNPGLPPIRKVVSVHECYTLARWKSFRHQKIGWEKMNELLNLKGLRAYEFAMYRDADKVLVLTSQGKKELLRFAPDLDIAVVPHGVDVDTFAFSPDPQEPRCIVFVGNYLHEPNVDAVLFFHEQVWPILKKKIPDVKFFVVGQAPPSPIRALEEDPSIVVTGTVEDVVPYLKKAGIFICPVRLGGGFRGKILEAMSLGRPVVSTELGAEGVPAVHRENIMIAETPEDFAKSIIELINDPSLYKKIQIRARELMEDKFAWEKGVARLENVLLDLMERPPKNIPKPEGLR